MVDRILKYKLDHLLFWTLTVFFHGYTRMSLIEKAGPEQFLLEVVLRNGLLACAVYITLLWGIPHLTKDRNPIAGLLFVLSSLLIYVLGKNAHDTYLYGYVIGDNTRHGFFQNSLYNISIVLFYLAFSSALHLSKQWYLQRQLIQKIELEKLNTELEYLRAQINPHFLFNAINTIYFQIDKQNLAARETLNKFSDMLRYQLYECSGNHVAIEKEIEYLANYVELQRLRKDENYTVEFNTGNDLTHFELPPLLLIPFVENAFKHVSNFSDQENVIKIHIERNSQRLRLSVYNTKDTEPAQQTGGIGLKNVTRRLDLLYAERYKLETENNPEYFSVTLELPLT